MKIAIFTDSFLPYICGVTSVIINQADELIRRGHQVVVFRPAPSEEEPKSLGSQIPKGLEVYDIPLSFSYPKFPDLHIAVPSIFRSLKKIQKYKPDVIHAHTEWGAGWEGMTIGRMQGIPVVGTFHTFFADPGYLKNFPIPDLNISRKMMWSYSVFFYNRCKKVIAPSNSVREALDRQGLKRRALVISNGIHMPVRRPDAEMAAKRRELKLGWPTFMYLGRVSVEKSLDNVLKAFQRVLRTTPSAKFLMIGDGPDRARLTRIAKELKVDKHIVWMGMIPRERLIRENLPRLGDVFVTGSKTENQPVSILEALAFGIPAIGPSVKGIPELIEHRGNGILCRRGSVSEMAHAMEWVAQNQKDLRKMATEAERTAKRHDIRRSVERLEKVYSEVIGVSGDSTSRLIETKG